MASESTDDFQPAPDELLRALREGEAGRDAAAAAHESSEASSEEIPDADWQAACKAAVLAGLTSLARHAGLALLGLARAPETRRLVAVGLFLGAFGAATSWVDADVRGLDRFKVPLDQLKVGAPPSYLSDRARAEVRGLHMAPGDFSAFEPRLVPTLAYALDRLPWVERVDSLELRYPAQVSFRLVLHKPAALLDVKGRTWAVSETGALFARAYVASGEHGRAPRLPVIRGLHLKRDGRELLERSLALISRLREEGMLLQARIKAVDVSNQEGRVDPRAPEVRLITDSGVVIDWGRFEGTGRLHIPFADKIQRLQAVLATNPELKGLKRLMLHWDKTTAEPEPAKPAAAEGSGDELVRR